MKKSILLLTAVFLYCSGFSQGSKKELVEKIEAKHLWLYAYVVEKTATINLSPSMWKYMLDENQGPSGFATFKRMGKAFSDLSDAYGGTYLEKKCGFSANTDQARENKSGCQSVVDGWGNKYSVNVNAANVQGTKDGFTMVRGYVSSVAISLEECASRKYTPKKDKLSVVINADNKNKAVSATWSSDGTTLTINAPGDIETAGWDSKIEKAVYAGFNQ